MNKIICDICGTTYPETADCCPICGFARNTGEDMLAEDLLNDNAVDMGGQFTARKKEIFDYDEVNAEPEDEEFEYEEDDEAYDDEEEEEEAPRHNTLLVILLTILIAGLLIVAGFVFVRFFLMNRTADQPAPVQTTAVVETLPTETTEPVIPCETLIISSGTVAEMNAKLRRVENLGLVVIDYLQLMTSSGYGKTAENVSRIFKYWTKSATFVWKSK